MRKNQVIEVLGLFYLIIWLPLFLLGNDAGNILPYLLTGLLLTFIFEFKNRDKNFIKPLSFLFGILPVTSIIAYFSSSILDFEILISALLSLALLIFYILRFSKRSNKLDPVEWTKLTAVFIFCSTFIKLNEIIPSFSYAILGFVFISTRVFQLHNISIMLKRILISVLIFFSLGLIIFSAIKANEASKIQIIANERVYQIEQELDTLKEELTECQNSRGNN